MSRWAWIRTLSVIGVWRTRPYTGELHAELNEVWVTSMTPSGRRVPSFPTDDLAVPAPPLIPRPRRGMLVMPIVGVGAMLGTVALMWTSGLTGARNPLAMMLPVTAVASGIGMFMQGSAGRDLGDLDIQRRRFIEHLGFLGEQLCDAAQLQSTALNWVHPQPSALWTLVGGPRMWEREPTDSDFLQARVGVGDQRLCRRLAIPALPAADCLDQVSVEALRRFAGVYSTVSKAPIALAITGVPAVSIAGDPGPARSLARAVICQLAVLHSPDHLSIDVRASGDLMSHWEWLKWLPHNACQSLSTQCHSVVIIDRDAGIQPPVECSEPGVTAIVLSMGDGAREPVGALRLRVTGQDLALRAGATDEIFGRTDGMSLAEAKACARRLSRHARSELLTSELEMWSSELNVDDVADIGPELRWASLSEHQRLCVPLGTTADGNVLSLNIREAIENGTGPHGLCIGATGSGKSELLRTLVLGMIARHSPDDLNLVLVDFKGGATFLDFSGMHHVAATITNLSDEAYLVTRMKDALTGEMHRRQQQLRRAGNVADVAAYRALKETDAALPPMPTLLIVVDEFTELLTQHPEFIEVFSSIGRLGRSLGMHMLLASQRLDESRLRGLESHLSYRICLKTLTSAESRSVLGVTDAADLPATPGVAILRSSDGTLTRFRTVRVAASMRNVVADPSGMCTVSRFSGVNREQARVAEWNKNPGPTVMESVLGKLEGRGSLAHQIWLQPLQSAPELRRLIDDMEIPLPTGLAAPIGVIDLPLEQRRTPLIVDASGAGGNIAVVGAPQTGKSTAILTLITSMSRLHNSHRIQFYCIDFGGGLLSRLSSVPHVGSIAARGDGELIRRTVAHVESLLRSRNASSRGNCDVFLIIDGWAAFREECGELEAIVTAIAAQGLSVGIHTVLSAARWADIRPALKDQIGTRLELRLADPVDSEIDRRQAGLVPKRLPGRGIADGGDHFVLAHPDFALVDRSRAKARPIPMLPDVVGIDGLPRHTDAPGVVSLGLGEHRLSAVALDFTRQLHLLILGDSDCGKTSALRALCVQLTRAASPDQTKLFLVDYRRSLLGVVGSDYLTDYSFSNYALAERLPELIEVLERRIPTANVTTEQLRDGSWWTGPRYFVVIDDYDLVADVGDSLRPLLRLVPYARDIGLHLIIARRCSGAARAMFEPLLSQIRDTGCPVLLMNGNPEEGSLIRGRRPAPQPVGRGMLIDGDDAQAVQIGWCPP